MGLIRKKEKISETDKVFKEFGNETNDVAPAGKQTRRQAAAAAAEVKVSQVKKEQLLDRMGALRKILYARPEFDGYLIRLEDAIRRLKGLADNVNKQAMSVIDNFLLASLNDAINYCNRGSYVAMGACIDNIENFIDDRFQCGSYYTDPKFCKFKLQRNRLYIEMQNQQAERDKLERRLSQLQQDYNNPNLHLSKDSVVREVTSIKEQMKRISGIINNVETQVKLLDDSINEIKMRDITHSNDVNFDITSEIEDMLVVKRENELDAETTERLSDKMQESHRKVSTDALGVNDDVFASKVPEELDDDFFKF